MHGSLVPRTSRYEQNDIADQLTVRSSRSVAKSADSTLEGALFIFKSQGCEVRGAVRKLVSYFTQKTAEIMLKKPSQETSGSTHAWALANSPLPALSNTKRTASFYCNHMF